MDVLEEIVTKKANPTVHRMNFGNIIQDENESINDYLVRLNASAPDCEYTCPNCKYDLSSDHVRDQFIKGLRNANLQTDVLSKAATLKTIDQVVKHSQAYEAAVQDQQSLTERPNHEEIAAFRSNRRNGKRFDGNSRYNRSNKAHYQSDKCNGCGDTPHNRPTNCPAWGKICSNCKRENHFAKVCFRDRNGKPTTSAVIDESRHVDAIHQEDELIAHVTYEIERDQFTVAAVSSLVTEIPALVSVIVAGKNLPTKSVQILPDSGASICLNGPQHMKLLSADMTQLMPCSKAAQN